MRIFISLLMLVTSSFALAREGLGVGVMLGQPTGVTGKKWLQSDRAVDAGAGWSIGANPHFTLHADYLWNRADALFVGEKNTALDWYYGLGARMDFADDIELGARLPLGVAHFFNEQKAELFGEIAPLVNLIPKTSLEFNLLVGLRIYF